MGYSALAGTVSTGSIWVVLAGAVAGSAFRGGRWTCRRYVLNSYLYLLLALTTVLVVMNGLEWGTDGNLLDGGSQSVSVVMYWVSFVVGLLCMVLSMWVSARHLALKHVLWLIFVVSLGVLLSPLHHELVSGEESRAGLVLVVLLTVGLLVFFCTAFALWYPEAFSASMVTYMVAALWGSLVLSLGSMWLNPDNDSFQLGLSYGLVILFSLFLVYDTQELLKAADLCDETSPFEPGWASRQPEYTKHSTGLLLDIVNLTVRLFHVFSGGHLH